MKIRMVLIFIYFPCLLLNTLLFNICVLSCVEEVEGFESWTARNFAEFKKRISGNLTSSNLKPARIQFEWRQKINVIKTWNWYNCRNNQSKFHLQISTRCCEWITLHVYIGISNQWLLNLMLYVYYVHLQNAILLTRKLLIWLVFVLYVSQKHWSDICEL